MTFKPEADRPVSAGQVNVSDLIAKYSQPGELEIKNTMAKLRTSSGKTHSKLKMPGAAPLIFFSLRLDDRDDDKLNRLKRVSEFVAGYMDRRAQVAYVSLSTFSSHRAPVNSDANQANKKLNSTLLYGPRPQFASRYSDPNRVVKNKRIRNK